MAEDGFLCVCTLAMLGMEVAGTYCPVTGITPGPLPILVLLLVLFSCLLLMHANSRNRREGASTRKAGTAQRVYLALLPRISVLACRDISALKSGAARLAVAWTRRRAVFREEFP